MILITVHLQTIKVFSVPTFIDSIPGTGDLQEELQSFLNESRAASRLIAEALTSDVAEESLAEAGLTVGALTSALATLTALSAALAIVAIINIWILVMYWGSEQVRGIPIIGHPIAHIIDYMIAAVGSLVIPIDNLVINTVNQAWQAALTVGAGIAAILHIPTIHVTAKMINDTANHLGTTITHLSGNIADVQKQLTEVQIQILSSVHGIYTRLQEMEQVITKMYRQVTDLVNIVSYLLYQVRWLVHQVLVIAGQIHNILRSLHAIEQSIVNLNREVRDLRHELHVLRQQVTADEAILAPAAVITAATALLLPLVGTGQDGIDNLVKTATDRCECEKEPHVEECWIRNLLNGASEEKGVSLIGHIR